MPLDGLVPLDLKLVAAKSTGQVGSVLVSLQLGMPNSLEPLFFAVPWTVAARKSHKGPVFMMTRGLFVGVPDQVM